jgi:DNA polymerase III delta prime subunit
VSGAGKKTLALAVLREIFGPSVEKVKVEGKIWKLEQGDRKIEVELTTISSNYHVEMNPSDVGTKDRYVVQEAGAAPTCKLGGTHPCQNPVTRQLARRTHIRSSRVTRDISVPAARSVSLAPPPPHETTAYVHVSDTSQPAHVVSPAPARDDQATTRAAAPVTTSATLTVNPRPPYVCSRWSRREPCAASRALRAARADPWVKQASDRDRDQRAAWPWREVIKDMAKSRPIDAAGQQGFKVLLLNEVDRLSKEAQHGLRRTMEKYSQACRLILICNSVSKAGKLSTLYPIPYTLYPIRGNFDSEP